jgi:hypothetical protein
MIKLSGMDTEPSEKPTSTGGRSGKARPFWDLTFGKG